MQRLQIKTFQWRYSLLFMLIALWLMTGTVQAAPIVTCSASISNIEFGSIDLLTSNTFTTTGTVSYSCKNTGDAPQSLTLCLNIGSAGINPRALPLLPNISPGDSTNLPFQLYKDSGYSNIWGSMTNGSTPVPASINVTVVGGATQADTLTIYAAIPPNQSGKSAGYYKLNFNINDTLVTSVAGINGNCASSSGSGPGVTPNQRMNTFYVQANAPTKCLINSKSNIDFGNTPSSANNIESKGTNPINITCTNGTVYNIGLAPSNGNKDGAGVMKGSGGNSDLVRYQLRSTPGLSGTPWGNTATSTNLGNGVTGTGTGTAQNKSVYATVPSADFKPDTYSDIVTISVNY